MARIICQGLEAGGEGWGLEVRDWRYELELRKTSPFFQTPAPRPQNPGVVV
jgi:hypothetical protein